MLRYFVEIKLAHEGIKILENSFIILTVKT